MYVSGKPCRADGHPSNRRARIRLYHLQVRFRIHVIGPVSGDDATATSCFLMIRARTVVPSYPIDTVRNDSVVAEYGARTDKRSDVFAGASFSRPLSYRGPRRRVRSDFPQISRFRALVFSFTVFRSSRQSTATDKTIARPRRFSRRDSGVRLYTLYNGGVMADDG